MNKLLSDALSGKLEGKARADVAAVRIMSAMRGPDSEDIDLKQTFTTPIRLWALSDPKGYDRVGYTRKVEPTPLEGKEHALALVKQAKRFYDASAALPWGEPNLHYLGHVLIALGAIAYLEGWTDDAFNRWFYAKD